MNKVKNHNFDIHPVILELMFGQSVVYECRVHGVTLSADSLPALFGLIWSSVGGSFGSSVCFNVVELHYAEKRKI